MAYERKVGLKIPSGGGGISNALQLLMMKNQLKQQEQQNVGQNIQTTMQQVQSLPGGVPVGTKYNTATGGLNVPLNPAYKESEIKSLGFSDALKRHSDFLLKEMQDDPEGFKTSALKSTVNVPLLTLNRSKGNILGFPTTMGDQKAQLIKFALGDMVDRIVRLRSGAQVNQDEFNRLSASLPTYEDFYTDKDGSFKVAKTKIYNFLQEAEDLKERVRQGFVFDDKGNRVQYNPYYWEGETQTQNPLQQFSSFNQNNSSAPQQLQQQQSQQSSRIDDELGYWS